MRLLPRDRWLRRLVPSLSRLTFHPAIAALLDFADLPALLLFPELRRLPPNRLRVRQGVGNRVVMNQYLFLNSQHVWLFLFANGWCDLTSTIVDLGCGSGRQAQHLRNFYFHGAHFSGRYVGVDVDKEAIEWCRRNFDAQRFFFHAASDKSVSYNSAGGAEPTRIPLDDDTADIVMSTSLFSHLLEPELENYIRETARVLKPGRSMAHTVFCTDYPPANMGDRFTFRHRIGAAHVESLRVPEAAVAYPEAVLFEKLRNAGLTAPRMLVGRIGGQRLLVAEKPCR